MRIFYRVCDGRTEPPFEYRLFSETENGPSGTIAEIHARLGHVAFLVVDNGITYIVDVNGAIAQMEI